MRHRRIIYKFSLTFTIWTLLALVQNVKTPAVTLVLLHLPQASPRHVHKLVLHRRSSNVRNNDTISITRTGPCAETLRSARFGTAEKAEAHKRRRESWFVSATTVFDGECQKYCSGRLHVVLLLFTRLSSSRVLPLQLLICAKHRMRKEASDAAPSI
jgi:hypothetical protein